jgi:serine/threonine protein kinase
MIAESPKPLSLDNTDAAYEALAGHVERFIAAWDAGGEPPHLAEHVPGQPLSLRKMGLVELIKVDLEYRYQRGCPKPLDDYFGEFAELLADGSVPLDLIYEEFHVRKQAGVTVDLRPYFQRFPEQRNKIEQLLGVGEQYHTTRVFVPTGAVEVAEGAQIDDFDLVKELGAGAFAKVFLARQRSMQRFVALKVSADQSDEPQTLAQLDHPHIVRVFDQRVIPERKMRLLYMQYIPGGTLQDVVKAAHELPAEQRAGKTVLDVIDRALENRGELLPSDAFARRALNDLTWPEAVCRIGASLAAALDYAHGRGVLHRDVKPANVLLTAEGSPKLADFNISFSTQVEGASPREFFGGSLAYMSPEQLEAYDPKHPRQPEEIDGRSDVYGLGVVLWEMLTGRRPFEDQMLPQGIEATVREMTERRRRGVPAAALKRLPADCPNGLRVVLLKCLAPREEGRYQNAGQLARELELCLEPDVQDLLHPPPDAWRAWAARRPLTSWLLDVTPESWRHIAVAWPLTAVLIVALVPNVILSDVNIRYNKHAIVKMFQIESLEAMFQKTQVLIVNAVAYTLGPLTLICLFWPIGKALRQVRRGEHLDHEPWKGLANRCLRIGQYAGWISLGLWIVTSLVFPAWLQIANRDATITVSDYVHFFMSTLFCGLIAASIAYFFITYIALRALYPRLLPLNVQDDDAVHDLWRAGRPVTRYFLALATVPTLSFTIFVPLFLMRSEEMKAAGAGNALAISFVVLGLLGMVGIGVCFFLGRRIQMDLAALRLAVSPGTPEHHRDDATPASMLGSSRAIREKADSSRAMAAADG